jgi:predicted nucleic acid-binding protein
MQNKDFADSNVFLYAFMADDEEKSEKAFSIIKSDSVVLSTQVKY